MVGSLLDRLVKKKWTDEDIRKYVGIYRNAALTHANDDEIRAYAASGGTTSALLIESLQSGLLDGAVVCNTLIDNGRVRAHFVIATNRDAILAARGSKYVETDFLREVLPLIRSFEGKLAVVGLPCDISALGRWVEKDSEIGRRVVLTIALVCGHNSRKGLIDTVTAKLEQQAGSRLVGYRFRFGHWRGRIEAKFANGAVHTPPTKIFNDYQNLFFFCERKCMACHDHYGYAADISVGDVWLFRLKNDLIKRSGIIIRNNAGQEFFDQAVRNRAVISEQIDVRDIMDGQSRIGPSHYNVSARVKAGKWFGLKLKDSIGEKVVWHHWLNAYLSIMNMRLSESALGKKVIFAIPRPLLKGYLYIKKALETLQ